MFKEVKIINGSSGIAIAKFKDTVLIQIGSGLNSYRVLISKYQIQGKPNLSQVPELNWGALETYMI